MATNPVAASPALVMDLLQSKKFRALLALIMLTNKEVQTALAIDPSSLPWITVGFAAFFISQGFRDLGEEIVKAVRIYAESKPSKPTPSPVPGFPVKPLT